MINWQTLLADCVDFTRRLVQTPSMPFEETAIAGLIMDEMSRLGFNEVWQDTIGNVNGRVHGRDRTLPALVLNSHLDHVDPGDPALWSVPPFSAEIIDGRLIGRGSADIKGPLAVQVYSIAAVLRAGERPRRDVVFSGVVQEEIGGAGAVHWAEKVDYPIGLILLGEPSDNNIAIGHRGIVQMWLTFQGRSVHASVPQKGQNPNYALADFLQKLADVRPNLSAHPILGQTTVSPTIIEVDTKSPNVTPAWTRVLLDFRTASESINSLQKLVGEIAGDWPHTITDAWCTPPDSFIDSDETIFGYYTPPESTAVQTARKLIAEATAATPALIRYEFATDGRHFASLNAPIIGYSPAEENQAHIAGESISIPKMAASLRGHTALLRQF